MIKQLGFVLMETPKVIQEIDKWMLEHHEAMIGLADGRVGIALQEELWNAIKGHRQFQKTVAHLSMHPEVTETVMLELIMMALEVGVRLGGEARVVVMAGGSGGGGGGYVS